MKTWNALIPAAVIACGLSMPVAPLSASEIGEATKAVGRAVGQAVFSEAERHVIEDYYARQGYGYAYGDGGERDGKGHKLHGKSKKDKGLPPGLAKRGGNLPPGLQKQLARNRRLPPGLQKKALPYELERRLPPVPRGYERVIADDRVVLIETASGIVADILAGVVLGPR